MGLGSAADDSGYDVSVFDPHPQAEKHINDVIARNEAAMPACGLARQPDSVAG